MIYTVKEYTTRYINRLFGGRKFNPRKPIILCRWYFDILPEDVVRDIMATQDIIIVELSEFTDYYKINR